MGATLKTMRKRSRKTQSDVAKELNISIRTLQNWERNITFPDSVMFYKICELYQCQLDDIIFPDELAKSENMFRRSSASDA